MAYTAEELAKFSYKELQTKASELGHPVVGIGKAVLVEILLKGDPLQEVKTVEPEKPIPLAEEAKQEPEPANTPDAPKPQVSQEDLIKELQNVPFIWLRGACQRLGLKVDRLFGIKDLTSKVAESGLASDIEDMAKKGHFGAITVPSLISEPVVLSDAGGNYTFSVYSDGSADIMIYASPNKVHRLPGQQIVGDVTFMVQDLFSLIDMATEAGGIANDVFSDFMGTAELNELAQNHRQQMAEEAAANYATPTKQQNRVFAAWMEEQRELYGFTHAVVPSGDLPYKVCEAFGVEFRKVLTDFNGDPVLDVNDKPVMTDKRVGYDEAVELLKAHIKWNETEAAG